MESVKNFRKVCCSLPQHEDELIIMVDSDPDSKKSLYCCLCLVEQSAQSSLPKTLVTFKNFISSTSEAFEKARSNAQSRGEAPPELADQISRKAEYLEKLTNDLGQQKEQLKTVFNKIRESILKIIDEKEKEYEKKIGDELKTACDLYGEFERILITGWPKASDLNQIFPLQGEIEQRFTRATDTLQLETLVEGLKEDINADQMFSGKDGEKSRVAYLESMIKNFKYIEANPPNIDLKELQIEKLEEPLKEKLNEIISQKAPVLNQIPKGGSGILSASTLLQAKDLNMLRSWLPKKFKLDLKLLYKSSLDGKRASDFHRQCDNKGPTITVIKCRFNGANKSSIIGGFTDQNWHSNSLYTTSTESFVFSLACQAKCPIVNAQNAIYGGQNYGPTFGGGHEIYVSDNFTADSYCNPHSYENTKVLVDFPGYQGGSFKFQPEEVEVFSIN